jgi:photosystem II stability/assembly factor-like uncharacterized protein
MMPRRLPSKRSLYLSLFLPLLLTAFVLKISPVVYSKSGPISLKIEPGNVSPLAQNAWSTNGPVDHSVFELLMDPGNPNILYTRDLFKSTDGGINWTRPVLTQELFGKTETALAIDPAHSNTLYAATVEFFDTFPIVPQARIYKSVDGGVNWTRIVDFGDNIINKLMVDPNNSSIIYAGTGKGVFKSTDNGGSWNPSSNGLANNGVQILAIDLNNSSNIYAGTLNGSVFKSTDAGANWVASSNGLSLSHVYALEIDRANSNIIYAGGTGGLFKSTNGGANWLSLQNGVITNTCASNNSSPPAVTARSVAIDPGNTNTIYAGTECALYKSMDGGAHWTIANQGLGPLSVLSLAINPSDTAIIYAGTLRGGVFKSVDDAAHWTLSSKGLRRADIQSLAVDPKNSFIVYAGTFGGLYKSTNAGDSWTIILPIAFNISNRLTALVIDPSNTSIIYALSDPGGMFKSTDGGIAWQQINNGLNFIPMLSLAIDPNNPSTLYVGDYRGLSKSVNGGASWSDSSTGIVPPGGSNINALVIDPSNSRTIYAGTTGSNALVYKSTNAGDSWTPSSNGLSFAGVKAMLIDPRNPSILYAGLNGTNGGMYKSIDGGANWTPINNGLDSNHLISLVQSLAIDPVHTSTLYLGGFDSGVFRSTDGGANWSEFNAGLPVPTSINALAVDARGQYVHAGTASGVYTYQYFNPLDDTGFFVQQQYLDFLNRQPDAGGLAFWTNEIEKCGANSQCIHERRVAVADAFFFEDEFQKTGAYIYRVFKATFGRRQTFAQFMADRGLVVAGAGLDQSKTDYALTFVQRDAFTQLYPRTQTADMFVDALLNSIKQNSNVDLASQRGALIALYDGTDNGRAKILRQVADNPAFIDAEYNSSFVLMEYFGYLRRDPEQGGFDFWLANVNKAPLRDIGKQHAMACSFITSAEYQLRFSSVVTHTNRECPQ